MSTRRAGFTVELVGGDEQAERYRTIPREHRRLLDKEIGGWTKRQRARLKAFSPARRGDYRRTGKTQSSWSARRRSMGVWLLINSAPWAAYVYGPRLGRKGERQAWMHRGRWPNADEFVADDVDRLLKAIDDPILEYLKVDGRLPGALARL